MVIRESATPILHPVNNPACDFPVEVADLYPKDFRYPEGYSPPPSRVLDRAVLQEFPELARPYVVLGSDDQPHVNGGAADVALARLIQRSNQRFSSAHQSNDGNEVRDGGKDELQMAEDAAACGHMGLAIATVQALPEPFRKIGQALRALVTSLKALGRYADALVAAQNLTTSEETPDFTDYAHTLHRIEVADLLLLSGNPAEAERLLNQGRREFQRFYQYFGVRAALALSSNDRAFAEHLIVQAGRVEPYHSYKLLWHPLLAPMHDFIRRELLDEAGRPRLYFEDLEVRRLCDRIQAAVLAGRIETAKSLAEGLVLQRVTDSRTTREVIVAMASLGYFNWAHRVLPVLPGIWSDDLVFARRILACRLQPGKFTPAQLQESFEQTPRFHSRLRNIEGIDFEWHAGGQSRAPENDPVIIAVVSGHCKNGQRERTILLRDATQFYTHGVIQSGEQPVYREDLRGLMHVGQCFSRHSFENEEAAQSWLETHIAENQNHVLEPRGRYPWEIQVNRYGFLNEFKSKPGLELMGLCWDLLANGDRMSRPLNGTSTMTEPFPLQFLRMVELAVSREKQEDGRND